MCEWNVAAWDFHSCTFTHENKSGDFSPGVRITLGLVWGIMFRKKRQSLQVRIPLSKNTWTWELFGLPTGKKYFKAFYQTAESTSLDNKEEPSRDLRQSVALGLFLNFMNEVSLLCASPSLMNFCPLLWLGSNFSPTRAFMSTPITSSV